MAGAGVVSGSAIVNEPDMFWQCCEHMKLTASSVNACFTVSVAMWPDGCGVVPYELAIVHCVGKTWNFALSGEPSISKTARADCSSLKSRPCVPVPISKFTVWPGLSATPCAGSALPFIAQLTLPLRTVPVIVIVFGAP